MLDGIALLCLISAIILLIALAIVDLKTRLLPNEMVAGLATLGMMFHLTTMSHYLSITESISGAIIGFGLLYMLRAIANHIYKTDTLGLGDVKLIGAGGLWLGPEALMLAMVIGATASVFHGLGQATYDARTNNNKINLSQLELPAGPGFAFGLIVTGIWTFKDFTVF